MLDLHCLSSFLFYFKSLPCFHLFLSRHQVLCCVYSLLCSFQFIIFKTMFSFLANPFFGSVTSFVSFPNCGLCYSFISLSFSEFLLVQFEIQAHSLSPWWECLSGILLLQGYYFVSCFCFSCYNFVWHSTMVYFTCSFKHEIRILELSVWSRGFSKVWDFLFC